MNLRPTVKWIALVLVVSGITATVMAQGTSQKSPVQGQSASGRYQIVLGPNTRPYLIDTQTGKIWSPVKITDVEGEPELWKYQERVDNLAEFGQWSLRQTVKPKTSPN